MSRWHDTPIFRAGITLRFLGWLAYGWPITTIAFVAITATIAITVPLVVVSSSVLIIWSAITRSSLAQQLLGPVLLIAAAAYTWVHLAAAGQQAVMVLLLSWPVDGLVDQYSQHYLVRRRWCEFRRGMPARFAIMAAKSTRIQGAIDGETQLVGGDRPALDHPALDLRATITGNVVRCRCSVSPGRNHHALREVLDELAASFPHVRHIDLVFTDEYQTFGHLVVTFGPTTGDLTVRGDRALAFLYQAVPHVVLGAGIGLVALTALG